VLLCRSDLLRGGDTRFVWHESLACKAVTGTPRKTTDGAEGKKAGNELYGSPQILQPTVEAAALDPDIVMQKQAGLAMKGVGTLPLSLSVTRNVLLLLLLESFPCLRASRCRTTHE
jgi:hypothetical protein